MKLQANEKMQMKNEISEQERDKQKLIANIETHILQVYLIHTCSVTAINYAEISFMLSSLN